MGEAWKETYVIFRAFSVAELEIFSKMKASADPIADSKKVLDVLGARFIGGKVVGEDGLLMDLTKEDLPKLSIEVLTKINSELMGGSEELKKD